LEIGLAGYWRFDEAAGDTVYDQTNNAAHATLHGGEWVTSTAPVGESSGLQRSCFRVAGRSFESGLSALLYYHQESSANDNAAQAKPLKHSARVMLAVATKTPNGSNHEIASLDFGVSATGTLAQTPDVLPLALIDAESKDGLSVNERLQRMSDLSSITTLNQDVINLTNDIAELNLVDEVIVAAVQNRSTTRTLPASGYEDLKTKIATLQSSRTELSKKRATEQALLNESLYARVTLYEHSNYRGRSLSYGKSFVGYTQLNQLGFNDLISSISIPESLQVKVYQHANRGGSSTTFTSSTGYVGNSWNDIISSMDISENPDFSAKIAAATRARQTAETNVNTALAAVNAERDKFQTLRRAKEQERSDKEQEALNKRTELQSHRVLLDEGLAVAMPLVHTDPFGSSITGGVLGFAWTNDAPLLFEGAGGKLALYFRGADDQFFVCYYNTFTQRAQYNLLDENGNRSVLGLARTTEAEMDLLAIQVGEVADDESLCTVTITRPNTDPQQVITETWQQLPRAPEKFTGC
jgi:Tfp pilus assembly major pilin PilA